MITYSIIQKSQLEGAHRLDAEYYQPEFLKAVELIKSKNHKKLGELIFVLTDYHANGSYEILRRNVRLSENPDYALMVRAIDLETNDFEDDIRYVSEHAYNFLQKTKLYGEEIIIDKIGSAGEVFLMPNLNKPVTLGMNLFMVRLKNDYDPVYVYTFLISKYGKALMSQRITGTVPTSIDKESVRGISIPIPSKGIVQQVRSLIGNHLIAIQESHDLYQQAEDLLLGELGLKDFQVEEDLSFVVNLSDVKSANRVDSDFFQPKYEEILKRFKNQQLEALNEHFQILKGKNFEYSENGEIGVIKTKQLGKQFINFEVEDKAEKEILEKEKLPTLQNLDVVFASMGVGSLGKINVFYDFEIDGKKYAIDSTLRIFRQIKDGKVLPEVLTVYLSSKVGQELIYKYVVGTSGIISIYEDYLKNFPVPILPRETQQKIAELVRKSHEARKKSKELLEEAKRKVEEMIEKGG